MVPLARTMADTGLIDTYPGLILAYVAQFLPFTIYLMTSYYSGIPAEIVDAARIDGNSLYGVYRRIMLPMGTPGAAVGRHPQRAVLLERRAHRAADDAVRGAPHPHGRGDVAARSVLRRHPHLRLRGADRRRARPGGLPVLPAPDRRRLSPPAPRRADMRITGYRTLHDGAGMGPAGRRRQRRLRRRRHRRADRRWSTPTRASPASGSGPHVELDAVFAAIDGEDPRGVTALYDRMLRQTFKAGHAGAVFGTIGAFDTALWDIKAQGGGRAAVAAAGRPRPRGARLRLRPGHRPRPTTSSSRIYQAYAERGLRAAKLKGGLDVERDRHRLTLVRDVLAEAGGGPRPGLMLDANECWTRKQAVRHVARARAHPGPDLGRGAGAAVGRRGAGRGRPRGPRVGRHRREPHRAGAVPPAAGGRRRRHRADGSGLGRHPLPARRRAGPRPRPAGQPDRHHPGRRCCTPRRRCPTTSPASCRTCSRRSG